MFLKLFIIFSISFFLGEPSPTRILLQPASVLRTFAFSEKYVFSRTPSSESIQIWLYFRIEISSMFMTFSVSIFALILSSIFHGKWLLKWSISSCSVLPFWLPFRDLFRRLILGCILIVPWLTLGSFGLPLPHFWFPLAPFWLHLARFWLRFGALGLTFADPCAQFSHFGGLLASFFIFVCIFD